MFNFFHNLFIPSYRNNHRSKLLHNSSLSILLVFLLFLSLSANFIKSVKPDVLGISYSISADRLLSLTNQVRKQNGLEQLSLNEKLSEAAQLKGGDMFKKNYWAHFAPDGVTPWYFIKQSGYKYFYAGENLARGFVSSEDAENAWLASPSHRENILSPKYKDVGFAILEGRLQGEETILIVELFGSQSNLAEKNLNQGTRTVNEPPAPFVQSKQISDKIINQPLIDLVKGSKSLIIATLLIISGTLTVDFIIVEKKKIPRLVGHNLDHIMIILFFTLFVILRKTGMIF